MSAESVALTAAMEAAVLRGDYGAAWALLSDPARPRDTRHECCILGELARALWRECKQREADGDAAADAAEARRKAVVDADALDLAVFILQRAEESSVLADHGHHPPIVN